MTKQTNTRAGRQPNRHIDMSRQGSSVINLYKQQYLQTYQRSDHCVVQY